MSIGKNFSLQLFIKASDIKFYVAATSGMFLYCVAVLLGEIEIFSTFFLQSDFLMGTLLLAKWGACQGAYRGLLGGNFGAIVIILFDISK